MFKTFTISDYAAWWGAIVATLVLFWEIYKWCKSGPQLHLHVMGNMKHLNSNGYHHDNNTYITFRISNRGDLSTTLSLIGMYHYKGKLRLLKYVLNKGHNMEAIFPKLHLPYELKSGTVWQGEVEQTDEMRELCKTGTVAIVVQHSHTDKLLRKILVIKNK